MNDRDKIIMLYDYYYKLFNEKQREYFEYYYFDNLSLSEISENLGVSRNAVHKTLKNIINKLDFYEDSLKLYYKNNKILEICKEDKKIEEKVKKVLESE